MIFNDFNNSKESKNVLSTKNFTINKFLISENIFDLSINQD